MDSISVHSDLCASMELSQESFSSAQLSQESTASFTSTDLASELMQGEPSIPEDETVNQMSSSGTLKKKKKRADLDTSKKVRKRRIKKPKDEQSCERDENGEIKVRKSKSDKTKRRKIPSDKRPEPEGGNTPAYMDPFDRVIYSNEPLFSDMEMSEEESETRPVDPKRPSRPGRPIGLCLGLNPLGSNTMIKFAIIGTEIQNVLRVSLKRVLIELR